MVRRTGKAASLASRSAATALKTYRRKRDFARTAEPSGAEAIASGGRAFVVQKHAASRLHYDFRLEMDGVLKSWAVAKGPSVDPAVRRLAVQVEDHPLAYGDFEGIIPKGQYGGGTVMLWDRGTWEPKGDPQRNYRAGHLKFTLHGERLQGDWVLVRMKPRPQDRNPNWLLIKEADEAAHRADNDALLSGADHSVKTGRGMDEIATGSAIWNSNRTGPEKGTRLPRRRTSAPATPVVSLPDFVPPELATRVDLSPSGTEWLHEIKFDGYRVHLRIEGRNVQILTRHGQDWTEKFQKIATAAKALKVRQAYLDGEAVILNRAGVSDFGALQGALSAGDGSAVLYLFDALFINDEDLRALPLFDRKSKLKTLLSQAAPDALRYSDHQIGDGPTFFKAASELGVEGIISKRVASSYQSGRTRDWLKIKRISRQEFVIVGFNPSSKDDRAVGSLLLAEFREGVLAYAGKVGTGFTAASARALHNRLAKLRRKTAPLTVPAASRTGAVWVEPRLVAEIEFSAWTKDRILRHASFVGLREDKTADEVEAEEVLPLANAAGDVPKPRESAAKSRRPMVLGIGISHPDRLIYPNDRRTKLDVAQYYAAVADFMLPFVAGRPLALVRCPDGVGPACFFQKHLGAGMSPQIHEKAIRGDKVIYVDSAEGLIGLVQWGVMEIHTWGSHVATVEQPDLLVFDFDPDPSVAWARVVDAALQMRDFLKDLGLRSFVKTTGGKGLHVVTPITPRLTWDPAKEFTREVAAIFAANHPSDFTINMAKKVRHGRMFIDYLRNGRGATAIAPYSTRARPGGLIATPVTWQELTSGARPEDFTLDTVRARLASKKFKNPWRELPGTRQSLTAGLLKRLEKAR